MPFIKRQTAEEVAAKLESKPSQTAPKPVRAISKNTAAEKLKVANLNENLDKNLKNKGLKIEEVVTDNADVLEEVEKPETVETGVVEVGDSVNRSDLQQHELLVQQRQSVEYLPLDRTRMVPKAKQLMPDGRESQDPRAAQKDLQKKIAKMEERMSYSSSLHSAHQNSISETRDSTINNSRLAAYPRIEIKKKDEQFLLEQKNCKMLADFSEEKLQKTIEQMTEHEVNMNVRQVQSTLFSNSINNVVTDFHKAQVGKDLSAAWPHFLWLSLWGVILGCSLTLLIVFSQIKVILNVLSYCFYFFIALEYLLMFAAMKTANYPAKPPIQENEEKLEVGKIGLVIPIGWGVRGLTDIEKIERRQGKIDVLTNTIAAALDVFQAEDIFVFHNSSDQDLPDSELMKCCQDRAVYVPISVGSKSISAYYGALFCDYLGYEYVIIMDDDTRLPKELGQVLKGQLTCDAYCMAIAAGSNDDYSSLKSSAKLLIGLEDIEYKLSDLSKITESNFTSTSSVLAPHGAINMWKTSVLCDIMREHNCIFHGEDYEMGLLMRMRHPEKRLGIINNCIVTTVAPSTLKELYNQRLTSWDLAAEEFLWGGFCASERSAHYMEVLFCLPCSIDNIFIRVITLEDIWTVVQDYLRVILLSYHIIMSIVYGIVNVPVLIMYLIVIGSEWIIAWALQYVKFGKRPDLEVNEDVKLKTVALFPIYRFCFSFVRVFALLRFFFKFESIKRNAIPIRQMNMPEPQNYSFAYSSSSSAQTNNNNETFNPIMIQEIVKMTLNQQKEVVRDPTKSGVLPRVFNSLDEDLNQENRRLIPSSSHLLKDREIISCMSSTKQYHSQTKSEDEKE